MYTKGILLDFWGTLFYPRIPIEEYHRLRARKLKEALEKNGYTVDLEKVYKTYRESRATLDLVRKYSQMEVSVVGEVILFMKNLSIPIEKINMQDIVEAYMFPYVNETTLSEGVKEFLEEALLKDYVVVLASNTMSWRHTMKVLRKLGLIRYFDLLALSDQIGFRKPSTRFFSYIIHKLNLDPEKSFMVGDEEADVEAKRLGFKTVAYEGFHTYRGKPSPDFKVASFSELADLI